MENICILFLNIFENLAVGVRVLKSPNTTLYNAFSNYMFRRRGDTMESAMVGNQLQAYMKKSGINPIKVGLKLFTEKNKS